MNGYLERKLELLQEKQNKINTEKQLLELLIAKEISLDEKNFECYFLIFDCFKDILIKESVDKIEFYRLVAQLKSKYKRKIEKMNFENYVKNYPFSWIEKQIRDIRNGGN